MLRVADVAVRFGGLQALDGVTLDVAAGSVTGLIGPNGAGKTTLYDVITGLQMPARGQVLLDGTDITTTPAHRRARVGIARTFQRLEVFGTLTVWENVLVAAETARAPEPRTTTTDALALVGLRDMAEERVDRLPTGTARLVELARALATSPRVLLLDEPSSGLTAIETAGLGTTLRELAGSGLAVLLVEHDMGLVRRTCERVFVLDVGHIIADGSPSEVQRDPRVRDAYLGPERTGTVAAARSPASTIDVPSSPPALELRGVRAAYGTIDVLHGVDLTIHRRQVVALLGPNGAGKSTTLRVASGQLPPTAGDVLVCGRRVNGAPSDALARAGLCTIPEGRGIFPNLTVAENLRMATYRGRAFADIESVTFERFPQLRDRRSQLAGTLSGGEQQMVAMARALSTDPAVLLIDELSLGLAPVLVETLYELVRSIADGGVSILLVEQLAHEVLGVADHAAIMVGGRVHRTGSPAEIADELSAAYLGVT